MSTDVGHDILLDMSSRSAAEQRAIVEACLEHLQRLPFVRGATIEALHRRAQGADVAIALETPTGRELLYGEVKRSQLSRESAELVVHRLRRVPGALLLAPAIGREIGDLFERADLSFVDTVGNCYLRLGDRYVARIQGRTAPVRRPVDRGLGAAAYRVLFALLVKPELVAAPMRAIAAQAGVSPQTASNVLQALVGGGSVVRVARRRQWAPGRRNHHLEAWVAGFRATLAPSLLVGRFRAQERDPAELERRIEPVLDALGDWRYGGGAAAMRLTHHYRGDTTLLYLLDVPPDLPVRLRLVRDPAGPIIIARAPGLVAFESPDPRSVHPLLAYADLLAENHDRAREAAGVLYERFLADGGDDG